MPFDLSTAKLLNEIDYGKKSLIKTVKGTGISDLKKYGKRFNSDEYKQAGYFGEIPLNNNEVATEYSIGQTINGKDIEMPSIIPTLNYSELQAIKKSASTGDEIPESVYEKAKVFAKERIAHGRSPFWGVPEIQYEMPKDNTLIDSLRTAGDIGLPMQKFNIKTSKPM